MVAIAIGEFTSKQLEPLFFLETASEPLFDSSEFVFAPATSTSYLYQNFWAVF